jgi:hypothetical protein
VARRLSLLFLAVASPLVVLTFFLPGPVAEYLFTTLVMAYPVALIALAVARRGRLGPLAVPLVSLLVILEACGLGMLVLRGRVADGPWIGGLPAAAAVQLYGLGLVPLLLVTLVYALTFDRYELRAEDLERLEKARRDADDAR